MPKNKKESSQVKDSEGKGNLGAIEMAKTVSIAGGKKRR